MAAVEILKSVTKEVQLQCDLAKAILGSNNRDMDSLRCGESKRERRESGRAERDVVLRRVRA